MISQIYGGTFIEKNTIVASRSSCQLPLVNGQVDICFLRKGEMLDVSMVLDYYLVPSN
jgi:hypothetical protein